MVRIVSTAWGESFGQVTSSNRTAIANRGWGPLNYNVLNHSEIQLTKTTLQNGTQNNNTGNATSPQELNLSDGYAGTLVDRVVEYRNREDARNGIDLDAQAHQCKETAQAQSKKRISASLLASAGVHALGPNVVLASAMVRKRKAEELVTERQNKGSMNL